MNHPGAHKGRGHGRRQGWLEAKHCDAGTLYFVVRSWGRGGLWSRKFTTVPHDSYNVTGVLHCRGGDILLTR